MKVLITGLNGFIGHHVAEHLLNHTGWDLVGLDRIDATSTLHRLRHIKGWERHASRVRFVWHDLRAAINPSVTREIGYVDHVFHLAASTHVDRSIEDPMSFVMDNVVGTTNLLQWWSEQLVRVAPVSLRSRTFVNFGTDEVFGPAPAGVAYDEWSRYNSGNPYAATKAGAEEMACAFSNTYKMRVLATHTMNVFGPRQHAEKFIPNTIRKVLRGEKVIVHADSTCTISGSRFYLHAQNVGAALLWLTEHPPEEVFSKWNIVGEREVSNLEIAQMIAHILDKPLRCELVDFHSSRPGHDLRYALDGGKLKAAGFVYPFSFEESLVQTVRWFVENQHWLEG